MEVGARVGAAGRGDVTHEQARQILRRAWQLVLDRSPSDRELAYAQAIALLETGYGRLGQFAAWAAEGKYNWGALQHEPNADGTCPPGMQSGMDASNRRCFYVYGSDLDAARAYLKNLIAHPTFPTRNARILSAMAAGSAFDVATAMETQEPGIRWPTQWFEDNIPHYALAIRNHLREIGEVALSLDTSTGPSFPLGPILVAGGLAAGAYWVMSMATPRRGSQRRRA